MPNAAIVGDDGRSAAQRVAEAQLAGYGMTRA